MSSEAASSLVGHGAELERLWRAAADGSLAHAILVRGPRGIGKYLVLRELASGLLCATGPGRPCGSCPPCKRFLTGNHADIFELDVAAEGEEQIKIERIVERPDVDFDGVPIDGFLRLKALEGGWRIALVREAQRMNESAQNAFLKMLEEPAAGVLLVLETAEPERLLPTLRSRLMDVELQPLAPAEVRLILERRGVPTEELEALCRWSRGSPGRALEDRARGLPMMRALLEQSLRGELGAAEACSALFAAPGKFAGKTEAAKARNRVRSILELCLDLLGDCLRYQNGLEAETLVHGDLAERSSAALTGSRLREALEACLMLRADVDLNLNSEATLHRALGFLAPPARAARAGRS